MTTTALGGSPGAPTGLGPISLVIPVRDEAESLPSLLDSISRQTRPPNEVVLVDGGSIDDTVPLAKRITGGVPSYRIIETGGATPGRGRNVGIEAASYDWIALADAGTMLEPHWLERLEVAAVGQPTAEVVWGNVEPRVTSLLQSCAAVVCISPRRATRFGCIRGSSVASCLLRRHAWEAAGRFPDLRATEDLIFMERLERTGIGSTWAPEATVWWSLPSSVGVIFRRFRSYSRHNVLAGRQNHWHHGVARIYLAAGVLGLGVLLVDRRLLQLLGAGGVARVVKSTLEHRDSRPLLWVFNPLRLAGVAVVLGVVDAATFTGWVDALLESRRPSNSTPGSRRPGRHRDQVSGVMSTAAASFSPADSIPRCSEGR